MGKPNQDWSARVEELAQTRLSECYQCGKCTAGCPRADEMDMAPTRLMRAAQIGEALDASSADSIWRCVSCLTCSTRCPKSVNVSGVVDALRQIAFEQKTAAPGALKVVEFHKAFLRNVRRNGRTNETELGVDFEARYFFRRFDVMNALRTAALGPKMLARGKMGFKLGSPVKDKELVKRIFDRCGVEI